MKLTSMLATAALATFAGSAGAAIQTPADVVAQFSAEVRAELVQAFAELDAMTVAGLRDLHGMYIDGARPFELEAFANRVEQALMAETLRRAQVITDLAAATTVELVRMDARHAYMDAVHDTWKAAILQLEKHAVFELGRIQRALDRMT